ncbi:uncharacterized protein G6M90_00g000900 [Metarhizium brunneum]|uniref:Uncharacterized protein n=1 Tax=Metarhizium brunneum TaxID=500148 RepID=A0A7D5UUT6_9HYPO|nr:hypothetical protein G6M90_00g000900 [Metarhizium brunneum]
MASVIDGRVAGVPGEKPGKSTQRQFITIVPVGRGESGVWLSGRKLSPNQTCNLPDGQDASHIPVQEQRPASTAVASYQSGHGDELRSSKAIQVFASQSQDLRAVFSIPTELRGSPTAHQGFPISVNGYSDIPRAGNLVRIGINSSRHGTQCTGFHVEFNRPRLDSCKPRI